MFAVIAASVVLYGGLADAKRNKLLFRLVLHCIMIVTSVVVPLELPMELSLAVMIIIFVSILLPFADDNDIKYHFIKHLSKHYYVILYMISMF